MRKAKVLHLVEDLKTGGLERVIADIAQGLDKQKFEVEVWCVARGGEVAAELAEKGIEVKILGIFSCYHPYRIMNIAWLLKKSKADIVHTHGYFASVIGRTAARIAGVPILIDHMHSTYWEYKKRQIFVEKLLSSLTHKVICCSRAVENFVTGHLKVNPSKTIVIYNGADEEIFIPTENSALKARLGIQPADPVVGTVSSLYHHKGHEYLLQAVPLVLEAFPSTKFLIVGDGPLRKKLEDQAEDLNISAHLVFTGKRKDVPDLLSVMGIFVLPSCSREGLGISIIEAMASEKPVVATEIGGIPEVVADEETGYLVPPQNPDALAKAIVNLLQSPQRAKEMGRRGRARFEEKFTKRKMLSEVENLYLNLMKERKHPG
jgi:glycosyltransferase involved in cell wall biosynthesis